MKIKFECKNCGSLCFFKTENTLVKATANKNPKEIEEYFSECSNCGTTNIVKVEKSS